jgi:hypothetical protein
VRCRLHGYEYEPERDSLTAWRSPARHRVQRARVPANPGVGCNVVLGCPATGQDRFDLLNTLSLHLVELALDVGCNGPDILTAGTSVE